MKLKSYALITVGLTAGISGAAMAQQRGGQSLRIVITATRGHMRPSGAAPAVLRLSFDKPTGEPDGIHKGDHVDAPLNSKPVKLEPVRIVASRDNRSSRSK